MVLIQQSLQNPVGLIQNVPPKLLAELAIGQRLEAVVVKATPAGGQVTIKVGDSVLAIRAPESLRAEQRIQLELALENGKPVLKFVSQINGPNTVPNLDQLSSTVKAGQQIAVEVIKALANNRLLVQAVTNSAGEQRLTGAALQRFDIDISKLSQRYQQGDKLTVDIVSAKPLTINLRPERPPAPEQIITERLQQLVRQQIEQPNLKTVEKISQTKQVPESVQREIRQLLQYVLDKPVLTKANAFKQALENSGVFTEKQLLTQPVVIKQDFKANIVKLIAVLEATIIQISQKGGDVKSVLNQLPSQVQSALSIQGKTPEQLLNILLSAKNSLPTTRPLTAHTTPIITSQEEAVLLTQLFNKPAQIVGQSIAASNQAIPVILAELQLLLKEVEGVHNKLQFNQMLMLKEPDSPNTVASWLFDVPIKDKQNLDLLQLQIDQHRQQSEDDTEDVWNVQLRLDTQNLGPLQATLTMHAEDIKIIFRAEQPQSAHLLEDNLPILDKALARLGVSMTHSSCYCGEIAKPAIMEKEIMPTNSIVDISV